MIQAPKRIHQEQTPKPPALERMPESSIVFCDVREELRAGNEPFSLIMAARQQLGAAGALCVRAIFEPVPLYRVMAKQGLTHWTERLADDDWRVWFYPSTLDDTTVGDACAVPSPARAAAEHAGAAHAGAGHAGAQHPGATTASDDVVVLDVRGLEPPEPLELTLAALETLPRDGTLVQLNVRVPQFLLPHLERRGFRWEVREADECVRVFIRHADA